LFRDLSGAKKTCRKEGKVMIARSALAFVLATLLVLEASAQEGPNRPEPKPVSLDGKTTAVLVLDLNARCDDPKSTCSKLTPIVREFLEKVRAAAVPIIYTVSASAKGKPIGELAAPLKRKEGETVIYPDAFDKFMGGELQTFLRKRGQDSDHNRRLDQRGGALHRHDGRPDISIHHRRTDGRRDR
jgi:hypothetical protein